MMSYIATFTLGIINVKRQDEMCFERVPVEGALSHADTLEFFYYYYYYYYRSFIRVLLLALESMEGKKYTRYQSHSTSVYIQNH